MTRMLSITSAKEEDGEEMQTSKWRLFMRLAQLSKPETGYNLLGLLASIVFGVGTPLFAVLFGEAMDVFAIGDYDEAMLKARQVIQSNQSIICYFSNLFCLCREIQAKFHLFIGTMRSCWAEWGLPSSSL